MKNFTFKLLQQLNKKKADKGFTLIELLVVIIIIGILSAIALPAFLNQAAKARQSEAKQALASLNKAQQASYLETQDFATNIAALGLGLAAETENYTYGDVFAATNGSFSVAADDSTAEIYASAVDTQAVKDYGAAAVVFTEGGNTTTTTAICEEEAPIVATGVAITFAADLADTTAGDAIACTAPAIELGDGG